MWCVYIAILVHMKLHIQLIASNLMQFGLYSMLLTGSSEEKLLKLTAGLHDVKVQFIPTETNSSSLDLKLKMIEKSKQFIMPPIGS